MAKQPTDDEQNLKRKSRRRLVGAVALALASVVIVPMVLDDEPKPSGQDIDLRIPAPDQAGAFIPKVDASKVAVELPASSVVVTPVVQPEAKSETELEPKPAEIKKEPLSKPPVNKATPPKEETKSATKETVAATGYVAQVGAYSNAERAQKVLDDLKGWKFKAYSEKSGDKIRVRVGPYAEREKIDKLIPMLEKHGLQPTLVTLP
ncbi:MAG: SPOR domain-containing protein [Gallionella sp.]